jgi:AcrR family transcriptional regulator
MANLTPDRESAQLTADVAEFSRGRVPRELRVRQILAVATELFVERGFVDASMDELARRVGVSKPVIYDAVGSKEALFGEVVAQEARALAQAVQSAVTAEQDPDQKLYAGNLAFFRFARERRGAWDKLLTPDAAPVNEQLTAARRFQASQVANMLAAGAAQAGRAIDPELLSACAQAINGANEALAMWWKEHPGVSAQNVARIATSLLEPGLIAFATSSHKP